MVYDQIIKELESYIIPEKGDLLHKYFRIGVAGYPLKDKFIGVKVPDQRKVAKKYYKQVGLIDIKRLLESDIHEYRLTGLIALYYKYEKTGLEEQRQIFDFYLANLEAVNNWDLVDGSADKIVGAYLFDKPRDLLVELAKSGELWKQRIAIIATYYFIKRGDFQDTYKIAEILLNHEHDLIHKAVGWMLREAGNRNRDQEEEFLKKYYKQMPRTMLRYAIEKFPEDLRQKFLKGLI